MVKFQVCTTRVKIQFDPPYVTLNRKEEFYFRVCVAFKMQLSFICRRGRKPKECDAIYRKNTLYSFIKKEGNCRNAGNRVEKNQATILITIFKPSREDIMGKGCTEMKVQCVITGIL